jgi:RsiW-degrading membrane proteinase PrsW (M82 family)
LLLILLSGVTLLVAELTETWSIAPTGIFVGALSGPLAFAVWVTDRTRVGRSVAPDVLFTTWIVCGAVGILLAGVFEHDFFFPSGGSGFLWIGLVEELAKTVVPLGICVAVPHYRTVEHALAFAIVSAGGFATMESLTYGFGAVDEGAREVRRVLIERSVITPIGHLPWTGIAVVVAATAWQADQRLRVTPRALWGLGVAIGLHTTWNTILFHQGWWYVLAPVVAIATFTMFYVVSGNVHYDGPAVPPSGDRTMPADPSRTPQRRNPPN